MNDKTQPSGTSPRGRIVPTNWFVPLIACLAAPVIFLLLRKADADGLTTWLLARDLAPAESAGAASEAASTIAGVLAAYLTLYFSISLLVLTIAASNLGVRLIDRWLGSRLSRTTIAGLAFALIFAVLTLAAIDGDASLARTPLALLAISEGLLIAATILLVVALHELGRTMFVDREIALIGDDAQQDLPALAGGEDAGMPTAQIIAAETSGYVHCPDFQALARAVAGHEGRVRFCAAPGQHVLAGEPLLALEQPYADSRALTKLVGIGPYRQDGQGPVYRIRLLVEIAARALSPAVNDFYSALAAVDSMGRVMVDHAHRWIAPGRLPVLASNPRIELPGQDFHGLFDDPLAALRQAAASYPSIAIRLIDTYAGVVRLSRDTDAEFCNHLAALARAVMEHASSLAEHDSDRDAIARAFDKGFPAIAATNG